VVEVTASLAAGGTDLPEGDYLRLEVSDTGCGMTEERKARIFEPFFTTKFAGRGLGLAVVQAIVRAHGGTVNLISAPGQGTRFQILLPCTDRPVELVRAMSLTATGEPISSAVGTVLLVEDEDTLRRSVSSMLRKRGFVVVEAGDGCAAVDLFRSHQDHIDVILLDITIPGSSSREVMAEARRIRPDIKVILTSAYSRAMVMPSLGAPRISAFIRKPFPLAELVELLRNTLAS
jgi:two-component system cell cycle sensor histidine kinase/response regulator CckA